jgi:hypothetical protein
MSTLAAPWGAVQNLIMAAPYYCHGISPLVSITIQPPYSPSSKLVASLDKFTLEKWYVGLRLRAKLGLGVEEGRSRVRSRLGFG